MSKSLRANYQETFLFPPCIEDWIGEDHPARFVREIVQVLDVEELGFRVEVREDEAGLGRPHYSEELLLMAWLYGYLNQIRSCRGLERACKNDVGLIWMLCRYEPDHNTLWRFWRRRRKQLRRVFRQVVRISYEANAVGVILHAVDGTKIRSRSTNNWHKNLHRKNLQELMQEVEKRLEEIEQEIESQGAGETEYRLPEELRDRQQLREQIQQALDRLEEEGKNHVSVSDPESCIVPCEEKKQFGYNAQVMVDEASGLIVAEEVVAEATDTRQLIPMLEQTEQNLGQAADDTVADRGYRTDENLGVAAERQYSVLVQLYDSEGESASPYHSSRFEYDENRDCCICPLGEELAYRGESQNRHGWKDKRYHCSAERCRCSPSPRKRVIRLTPYHPAIVAQRKRQRQAEEQAKLKRRRIVVEPIFADLKHNQSFRRWTFFGLENVQTQWSMLCTAFNLKKLYKEWATGQLRLTPF